MVVCAANAVDGGVAHVDVGVRHVDFGAEHHAAVGVLAVFHFGKACQVFGYGAAAVGAVYPCVAKVASVLAHFFCRLLIHISQPLLNEVDGGAVHKVKVVAGVVQVRLRLAGKVAFPRKAQPVHGFYDGVHIFLAFFFGVGVVKAQVAHACVVVRQAEVQADAFGVPHVQVAVGLGRKAGADFGGVNIACGMMRGIARAATPATLGVCACCQVGFDDLAQEVARFYAFFAGAGLCGVCVGVGVWIRIHVGDFSWLLLCISAFRKKPFAFFAIAA